MRMENTVQQRKETAKEYLGLQTISAQKSFILEPNTLHCVQKRKPIEGELF